MSEGKNSTSDKKLAIYNQDCEFYRYQDGLRWNRFQTISALEGAVLYGVFQQSLSVDEKVVLYIFGSFVILLVSILALKDTMDANLHLTRLRKIEKDLVGADYTLHPARSNKTNSTQKPTIKIGFVITWGLFIVINLVNFIFLVYFITNWANQ